MRNLFVCCFAAVLGMTDLRGQVAQTAPRRTPDGQPDLQGVWTNATLTPLQRPADLGGKQFFTPQEALVWAKLGIPTKPNAVPG